MLVGSITVFQLSLHPWRYSVESNPETPSDGPQLAPLFNLEQELWRTSPDRRNLLSLLHYLAQLGYMVTPNTSDSTGGENLIPPRYLFAAQFLRHFACAIVAKRLRLAHRIKKEHLIPLSTLKDNLTADFTRIMPRSLATHFRSGLDAVSTNQADLACMTFAMREYEWVDHHIQAEAIEPPLPIGHDVGNIAVLSDAQMTTGLAEEVLRESNREGHERPMSTKRRRINCEYLLFFASLIAAHTS